VAQTMNTHVSKYKFIVIFIYKYINIYIYKNDKITERGKKAHRHDTVLCAL
jgi:hypothetical protein